MTRDDHKSGTDRVAEVAHSLDAEIIVNVQGDEPLIDPATIDCAVSALMADEEAQMATTCEPISDINDVLNPAVVKVIIDNNGYVLAPVPVAPVNTARSKQRSGTNRRCFFHLGNTRGFTSIAATFSWISQAGHSLNLKSCIRSNSCGRWSAGSKSK